jgi:hypothetical protein
MVLRREVPNVFQGCSLCNGVGSVGICPQCGYPLEDYGMIEDFLGPYSPYENDKILEWDNKQEKGLPATCEHLVYCKNCQYDMRIQVKCN